MGIINITEAPCLGSPLLEYEKRLNYSSAPNAAKLMLCTAMLRYVSQRGVLEGRGDDRDYQHTTAPRQTVSSVSVQARVEAKE